MLKTSKYYYSDAMFQLEINLHKVRKELITMLEFYEQTDCETCLLLKCKCTKADTPSTSDTQSNNKSGSKSTTNNTPCTDTGKEKSSPAAEALPTPKLEKKDKSPAPSTPEKVTVTKDIEAWMEASKKLEAYSENVILNPKKSLVTIESVRPADLPLKTLQKSSVLNSSSFLNSQNIMNSLTLEAFLKYVKPQMSNSQVAYVSTKLAEACKNQIKQNYSYF